MSQQFRAAPHLAHHRHISDVRGAEGCYHCWMGQYDLCQKHCKLLQKQPAVILSNGYPAAGGSSGGSQSKGTQFLVSGLSRRDTRDDPFGDHPASLGGGTILDASQDYFLAQRAQQSLNSQLDVEQRRVQALDDATPFFTAMYQQMQSMYPDTQVHQQLRNEMQKERRVATATSSGSPQSQRSWYQTLQQTQKQVSRDLEVRRAVLGPAPHDAQQTLLGAPPSKQQQQQRALYSLHEPQVYVPATYRQGEHAENVHKPKFRSSSAGASTTTTQRSTVSSGARRTDHTSSRLLEIRVTPYTVIRGSKALDTRHLNLLDQQGDVEDEGGAVSSQRSSAAQRGGGLYRQGAMWSGSIAKYGGFADDKRSQELREAKQRGRSAGLGGGAAAGRSASRGASSVAARGQSPGASSAAGSFQQGKKKSNRSAMQEEEARIAGLRSAMEMPLPKLFDEVLYL